MSLLECLERAHRHFSEHGQTGLSSPFGYKWTNDDTRQLLEDAAKEIRKLKETLEMENIRAENYAMHLQ